MEFQKGVRWLQELISAHLKISADEAPLLDFLQKDDINVIFIYTEKVTKDINVNTDNNNNDIEKVFVDFDFPNQLSPHTDLVCFIKLQSTSDPSKWPSQLSNAVYCHKLNNYFPIEDLHKTMSENILQLVLEKSTWPPRIKKEFTGHVQKFMASLTEVAFQVKGCTVLYIPNEPLNDLEAAVSDKDLVQRLESILIHWTRQIKEVITNQDNTPELSENAGPLAEIEFWRSRTVDLSGIREQLERAGVKRIQSVLELAKSSYLQPFLKLSDLIQKGSSEAQDNLKFLSLLQEPCEELAKASPREIPSILPKILNCIRMIWGLSKHYNSPERMTGLFRKVSNEIINRCRAHVSLRQIFEGDVQFSIIVLEESIQSGESWKDLYNKTAEAQADADSNETPWNFEWSNIFAQIDAFVQRCRDLLEICEAQTQFARKTSSGKLEFPAFGGSSGPDVAKSLQDIENAFEKHIQQLKNLRYDILDVKVTRWHDDYNAFKRGIKDLEVMMRNVITTAFSTVSTVYDGIELLEIFVHLAKRETIKRVLEKKTAELCGLFIEDVNKVKREFDVGRLNPPVHPLQPKNAGAATWAKGLLLRLRTQIDAFERAIYLHDFAVEQANDARNQFQQVEISLEEYIKKMYNEWLDSIQGNIMKRLNIPLMTRSEENFLQNNFDEVLQRLFNEVFFWQRLSHGLPEIVMDLYKQQEKFRVLRENVLLVVRDYNNILKVLSQEERRLFKERVEFLDSKIKPGLTVLTWTSGDLDGFVKECRKHAGVLNKIVSDFKDSLSKIQSNCTQMSEMMLISLRKKKVYRQEEFESREEQYRQKNREKLDALHNEIRDCLNQSYQVFKYDTVEVQKEWVAFTEKVDKMVEHALRQTVKRSLLELSKSINGDGKNEVFPLFHVNVVLDMNRVELKPSIEELSQMVNHVAKELVKTISTVPRFISPMQIPQQQSDGTSSALNTSRVNPLPTPTESNQSANQSFYNLISDDEEILKIFSGITMGIVSHLDILQKYLANWDRYKHLWDLDKDAYIRRYAKSNPTLELFEADILERQETQRQIENEETITNIAFLKLDCTGLKHSLVSHCNTWQNKFTSLLASMAQNELNSLHEYFSDSLKQIKVAPRNLDMLRQSMQLIRKIQDELPVTEARFEPLQKQYKLLEKFEVQVEETSKLALENIPNVYANFKQALLDAEEVIRTKKEHFKSNLLQSAEDFGRVVVSMKEEFAANIPKTTTMTNEKAFATIADFRKQLNNLIDKENKLKQGLTIFQLDPPVYKELSLTAKELDLIEQVWKVKEEWEECWEGWKTITFKELTIQQMEDTAQKFQKRIVVLGRDIKHLPVWIELKERVDQFKVSMPLIQDLKNPALRQRHWEQLKVEVGKPFDPESTEFTLQALFSLGLDGYADIIATLSISATKELAIEESLRNIEEQWNNVKFELLPHKDTEFYRLRSADEIFQLLEDHQVTLSTMKSSRYYYAFETQVEHWERTLSHILETTEMLLQVQRAWRYLENIFAGFEDIRRQLPSESSIFDKVNSNWKLILDRLVDDPNALRGTHKEGLLEMLVDMNTKLEKIQKSLDQYLETKRTYFPRFYFLSNDDLLEILGQSKEPLAVQNHLSKCFDNIKRLEFTKENRKKYEALGMHSVEGEYVPFVDKVTAEGAVEVWLTVVENTMRITLKKELIKAMVGFRRFKKEKWINDTPGQLVLSSSQIAWTHEVGKALNDIEAGDKNALRELRKKQGSNLKRLSDMVKGNLTKLNRLKLVALLTIEIHARDVIERLIKSNCSSEKDFEWRRQLRYYWEKEEDEFMIRQTNSQFAYGYEYLGNTGRLVVTPLTERCYTTLTTALYLKRGGNPQGPAGTGKTETVKDLAKAFGKYVLVFNCSESLDYKSLGRTFSGLAQTGAWSCFDEFNRIEVEVLSVVAQQISSILTAIAEERRRFIFEGVEIKLNPTCGIFITMNPGYAGRSELPDNMKSLFRPCAMMVPDFFQIAEIMLYSEGFSTAKYLSKKIVTLYELASQQLSKQDHYDFTLRAIKSVLVTAGSLKRADTEMPEDLVLLRALRDTNLPKFVGEDTELFLGILSDLFPGAEPPEVFYGALQVAIEEEFAASQLQSHPELLKKIIQLYETKLTRHGVMVVGHAGCGKTTCWKILQQALNRLKKQGTPGYNLVRTFVMNPKAISVDEMYGGYDKNTREWRDGILANVMRVACSDEKPDEKWIVFDGPVDTIWIESMNSVLDDNKVLTLANSERIYMPPQVSLLFEVPDLAAASPATVSRCGMIYISESLLGWRPYVDSWLAKRQDKEQVEVLRRLFDKYAQKSLDFKREKCTELFVTTDLNSMTSLCNLFDALATPENGVSPQDTDFYERMTELWFLFSLIWSVGASVDEESRKKFDMFLREIEGQFPHKDTVYEYYVDPSKKGWSLWEEKIPANWKYQASVPFYKILVPTVDTVRNTFLITALLKAGKNILLVGNSGTGKTSIVQNVLSQFRNETSTTLSINFSAQTSSQRVQEMIEERVEKRTKDVYVPTGGKKMICFIDDLNMPRKDEFGSQPPLELIRQWIDYGFWYDRAKQTPKVIKEMHLICAMGPPGGGRSEISARLQSRFNLINITFPSESQIKRIYGTLINQKLSDFEEEVKPLGDLMTQATIELYDAVVSMLLPTPDKSHYIFNLRDMSKVFQGLLQVQAESFDNQDSMIKLWVHECFRVFHDRLVDDRDRQWFRNLIVDKLASLFGISWSKLYKGSVGPTLFGDFMNNESLYQELSPSDNLDVIRTHMVADLEEFNVEAGNVHMDLVLFKDAIEHVCRIHRIIKQPRGNVLLVGVGGSGRQSLTRLAASMAGYKVFHIEVRKNFRDSDFREKLKDLYYMAGIEDKQTVFLFTDTQIKSESFLEDICNILSRGEIPNLYTAEELATIRDTMRQQEAQNDSKVSKDTTYYERFIERAWNNIHVVLCMSPVGESFRNRCRMFPALVNCSTIDWFSEWPEDALREVAMKFLDELDINPVEMKNAISEFCVVAHQTASQTAQKMTFELKREYTVTPTNYLQLVQGYMSLLKEKRASLKGAAEKLSNGLIKLDDTRKKVEEMSISLEETKRMVAKLQKECEEYLMTMVQRRQDANEKAKQVAARSEKIAQEEAEVKEIASTAQADLDKALPAMEVAKKALASLNKKDMAEVKAYANPPPLVEKVMAAVMVLRKSDTSWAEAKRQLNDPNFLPELINYAIEKMTDSMLKKVEKYCADPEFRPEKVGKVSAAARSLCMWVRAMEKYGHIYREVAPKQLAVKEALQNLESKTKALSEAQQKLKEADEQVAQLKAEYNELVAKKDKLRQDAELTTIKLERAEKLVAGLASEKARWERSITEYEIAGANLPGDCLLAAAFLSYCGPFTADYRQSLLKNAWLKKVKALGIPCTPEFNFVNFMASQVEVREWNLQGLPNNTFSQENGVLVTRTKLWPLMIDPQGQANKWIRNMEKHNSLKVITLNQPDFMRTLENAMHFGAPVLLQDIGEELDPTLDPILNKSIIRVGNRTLIKLEEGKEVEYNTDFRLYITSKHKNPKFKPEISTKTTIVNFTVTEQGLEAQLLAAVVRHERRELEEQKDDLVMKMAQGKKKLFELEDKILHLLNTAQGSLLDNEHLVNALQSSKETAEEIKQQLAISEQTEIKIDHARQAFSPCSVRAATLFFVLNDLSLVDPMYQFSLDFYIELFNWSIERSTKSDDLQESIRSLNDYHTSAVYKSTCRGLFEKHKLLFAFQMCVRIMESERRINKEEYKFFLRGGQVLNKENQMPNPAPDWLPEFAWDNLTILDHLPNFRNIASSFEQNIRDWKEWYLKPEPESVQLPGEWQNKCNELQHMVIVRCFRPDRVLSAITTFITSNLDNKYVDPPPFDLSSTFEIANPSTPLIFILSPGVDPTNHIKQLAEEHNMANKLRTLALGQGQAGTASRMIEEGIRDGNWVFLANCHLMLSWLDKLEVLVEDIPVKKPHPTFRLWLSSNPTQKFPISILQKSIKITTEPPKGIKQNLQRLYGLISDATLNKSKTPHKHKKLLFALCFFHSVLLERKKFMTLGWNTTYDFNDSDFEVSEILLSNYLDDYPDQTPWDAIRYLIADLNYGGRVTDKWDRRLLSVYSKRFFCPEAITTPTFRLSSMATYYIPEDGTLQTYKDYVSSLPLYDKPEVFGQHSNADIASLIQDANNLLDTLVSLQPRVVVGTGESREAKVLSVAQHLLKRIPNDIEFDPDRDPTSPLKTVLVQEISRYNALLRTIRKSLIDLQKGIKGLIVMSSELDEAFSYLHDSKVPPLWQKVYPSLKSLAPWIHDLIQRTDQMRQWAEGNTPKTFWLGGFTFPTGFLTAVMQISARKQNVPIDSLTWEFIPIKDTNVQLPPDEGIYVSGLVLEGAKWDYTGDCLTEPNPMELYCQMPIIHFKPVEIKKRAAKDPKEIYVCPCYMYPVRSGSRERPSFMVAVELNSGAQKPDHWIKRGTALLLSTT